MISLTFMKRELLEEWVPLINRSYKILSERGETEIDSLFVGFLKYVNKEKC